MKRFSVLLLILSSALAQIPPGYYDTAEGLNGDDLRLALHNIIDDHNVQSYSSLWTHFQSTDKKPNNKVWDMYSDVPGGTPPYEYTFGSDQCGNYGGEGDCYNREHSWPKSWFNNTSPMNSDMFHLYPTDGYVNGMRSNYPFGEVSNATWTSQNGSKRGTMNAYGFSGTVFEPIDEYKGDFARTYFYMSTRYYTEDSGWDNNDMVDGADLKDWAVDMLLAWHEADPVSEKETDRNNAVYDIQNNRNPFIDYPEWADCVWGECGTGTGNTPPVANAGADQTVIVGATVFLDGSGSYDSDGFIDLYQWEQLSGENVTLSTYNGEVCSFETSVTPGSFSFSLTVTDNEGSTSSDIIHVYSVETIDGDLFISEYGEGSGVNRYLEIFNPTSETIDLSQYGFPSVGNTPTTPGEYEYWNSFPNNATIAPLQVYIIAHPEANSTILSQADMTHQYLSNGNDGYALVKGSETNFTIVDWLGDWNGNPGDGWSVAGVTNGTLDHTLMRKPSVSSGNLNWESSAGTNTENSEWIVYNQDVWDYLGAHEFDSGTQNTAPIADAGEDQIVMENETVYLDGTGSYDEESNVLTYQWRVPNGAELNDNTSPTPTFITTTTGDTIAYLFSLIVSDGELSSEPDTVIIAVNPQLDIEQHTTPSEFELLTVFPNPFNPTTTIQFHLDKAGDVSLGIFNIHGKSVETLIERKLEVGKHSIQWSASTQPSGVYFVKIQSGSKSQSQKIILLK